MFGNKGIFGENVHLNRAREAELDADLANDASNRAHANLEEVTEQRNRWIMMTASIVPSLAASRAVLREVLVELKASDPTSPLLNKEFRDKLYLHAHKARAESIKGLSYLELKEGLVKSRDDTFGATGSTDSGPDSDKVTPNILVRAAVQYPTHQPDREKLISLVKRLSSELQKRDPNAAILNESKAF